MNDGPHDSTPDPGQPDPDDMAEQFRRMMQQFGISYRTAGENIAMGQTSPAQVMNSWMNSEGHRKNILNASFTQIGVGIAKNANGQYIWTQQFIG